MARQRIGADEAFEIPRRASQRTKRELRDIAADIVSGTTGERPGRGARIPCGVCPG